MKKLLSLLCLSFILACSSPQESLQKRDYDKAFRTALRQLEKGKSVNKNEDILRQALDGILAKELRAKENLIRTNQLENLEKAIKINRDLQKKIDDSARFLDNDYDDDYADLQKEEIELSELVATTYFEDGKAKFEEALSNENKGLSRDAYHDLIKAKKYGFDRSLVEPLLEQSLSFSIVKYVVEGNAPFDIEYNWEIDRKLDNLEDVNDDFRQIFYEKMINNQEVDCYIEINFKSLDFDTRQREDSENYKKEVVVGTKKITNDKGEEIEVDKIEEVEGRVIEKKITKTGEWRVNIYIRSNSRNCNLSDTYFTEELSSQIVEYEISGDERAIPSQYQQQNDDELMSDDDMVDVMLEEIYAKVASYIFN